jgi:hypothetical protein
MMLKNNNVTFFMTITMTLNMTFSPIIKTFFLEELYFPDESGVLRANFFLSAKAFHFLMISELCKKDRNRKQYKHFHKQL